MKTSNSLDQCSISQLEALLSLAVEPNENPMSLPAEAGSTAKLRRLLSELFTDEDQSGELLLDMASAPDSKLEAIQELKEIGKRLVTDAPTEAHRNAARVLYHAAIAAAYAHHGVNLSSHPIRARLLLYEEFAALLAGEPLGTVFRAAVECAERDKGASGNRGGGAYSGERNK